MPRELDLKNKMGSVPSAYYIGERGGEEWSRLVISLVCGLLVRKFPLPVKVGTYSSTCGIQEVPGNTERLSDLHSQYELKVTLEHSSILSIRPVG